MNNPIFSFVELEQRRKAFVNKAIECTLLVSSGAVDDIEVSPSAVREVREQLTELHNLFTQYESSLYDLL